jgi:hypothetical protein
VSLISYIISIKCAAGASLAVFGKKKHGRGIQKEGHYFKKFGFLSTSRDEDYKAPYLSYCSNFSMRSWINVLQNHVMAANYYLTITDNNCAKWASISTINSSVCFFNRL